MNTSMINMKVRAKAQFDQYEKLVPPELQQIYSTYGKYDSDSRYVFRSCNNGNAIVILEKTRNTLHNENRYNVCSRPNSENRASELMPILIFNKFAPSITYQSALMPISGTIVNFVVGNVIRIDNYEKDMSVEYRGGIFYFKTLSRAFYDRLIFCNYTGPFIDYHYNGSPHSCGYLVNGKESGEWFYFYSNGQVKSISMIDNCILNGFHLEYYENGHVLRKGMYVNDVPVGFHISWHENGKKESEGSYDSNGEMHGNWSSWYEDEGRDTYCTYVHGNLIGAYIKWKEGELDVVERAGVYKEDGTFESILNS